MSYMHDHFKSEVANPDDEPIQLQCRHIKPDGIRCGSPSLRNEPFCYYHHTARRSGPRQPQVRTATDRKSSTFDLPAPADLNDRAGVQLAIALILHKIANNEIDPRRAGLLLYGLQIASGNLKQERPDKKYVPPQSVEELTEDPTHGPLAPEAELQEPEVRGSGSLKRLIYEMSFVHDEPKTPPVNPIPSIQANTPTQLNRACRRQLRRMAAKAGQGRDLGQNNKPGRSRACARLDVPEVQD